MRFLALRAYDLILGLAQLIAREEPPFYALDREKISDRHERECAHDGGGHWDETEPVCKRRIGKRHRHGEGEERACHERRMRPIPERVRCANDEDYQDLGREGFDE